VRLEAWGISAAAPPPSPNEHGLIAIELVFADQIIDHRDDLVGGDIENDPCGVRDGFADPIRQRRHGALRSLGATVGMQPRFGVARTLAAQVLVMA